MTIDWTQPVETTEDPPRPVRVLCTNLYGAWPIASEIGGLLFRFATNGDCSNGVITLRNVAPKPEPVLREAWANLYEDGAVVLHLSKPGTATRLGTLVECHRIAWMSDGSPVPSEASGEEDPTHYGVCEVCVEKAVKSAGEWRTKAEALLVEDLRKRLDEMEKAKLKAEFLLEVHKDTASFVEHWKAKAEETLALLRKANDHSEALQAEVDRLSVDRNACLDQINALNDDIEMMRPVVDAAVAWVRTWPQGYNPGCNAGPVFDAVRAYQSQQAPATVGDVLEGIRKRLGEPVKTCTTCGFSAPIQVGAPCVKCHDFSEWRTTHDPE